MSLLPPVLLELRAKADELFATTDEVKQNVKDMADSTDASSSRMQGAFNKAAGAGKVLATGIVAAGIGIGTYSVGVAVAAQVTDAKLSTAIKNAGGNVAKFDPQVKSLDSTMRSYGFTNDQTNASLAQTVTALKNPTEALKVQAVAANLAREKNISLSAAAALVTKGMEGQTRPLRALGIDLPVVAGGAEATAKAQVALAAAQAKATAVGNEHVKTVAEQASKNKALAAAQATVANAQTNLTAVQSSGSTILAALTSRVKGQASAFGDTLAGKVAQAKAQVSNIGEEIGKVLIPVIVKVISTVQTWVKWLTQNQGVLIALGATVGSIVAILIGFYVAQKTIAAGMAVAKAATIAYNVVAGIFGITTKASTAASYGQVGATYASVAAQKAYAVGLGISKAATAIATAAQWLFNAALDANPIGIVVVAIAALVAGLVWFFTQTKVGKAIWKDFTGFLVEAWKNVSSWFVAVGQGIAKWWNGFWNGIVNFASSLFKGYIDIYIDTFKFLYNGIVAIGTDITNWWNGLWNGITSWLSNLWNAEVKGWTDIFQWLYKTLVGIGKNITSWWNGLWNGVVSFIQDVWNGAGDVIVGFFNHIIDAIDGVIAGLNGIAGGIKNITGGAINFSLGKIPHIPSFDVGTDRVPGPTGAPVKATIHAGEAILSNDMLSGRKPIPSRVVAAVQNSGKAGRGSTGPTHVDNSKHVTVMATTNASSKRIAQDIGWELDREG